MHLESRVITNYCRLTGLAEYYFIFPHLTLIKALHSAICVSLGFVLVQTIKKDNLSILDNTHVITLFYPKHKQTNIAHVCSTDLRSHALTVE